MLPLCEVLIFVFFELIERKTAFSTSDIGNDYVLFFHTIVDKDRADADTAVNGACQFCWSCAGAGKDWQTVYFVPYFAAQFFGCCWIILSNEAKDIFKLGERVFSPD